MNHDGEKSQARGHPGSRCGELVCCLAVLAGTTRDSGLDNTCPGPSRSWGCPSIDPETPHTVTFGSEPRGAGGDPLAAFAPSGTDAPGHATIGSPDQPVN